MSTQAGVWLDENEVASLRRDVAWLGQIAARSVSDEPGAWQSVVNTVDRSNALLDAAEARSAGAEMTTADADRLAQHIARMTTEQLSLFWRFVFKAWVASHDDAQDWRDILAATASTEVGA